MLNNFIASMDLLLVIDSDSQDIQYYCSSNKRRPDNLIYADGLLPDCVPS